MSTRQIAYSELRLKPNNVRRQYQRIPELAKSVHEHGLLQNLVVREVAPTEYEVVAGNRRYKAIGTLIEAGHWRDESGSIKTVPCLVISAQYEVVNLVENIERENVLPWELGYKYAEFQEAGLSQEAIAARIGRSQGHVSRCLRLAHGLAPKTVRTLQNVGIEHFSMAQLLRLSTLWDEKNFEPDESAQLELLQSYIEGPKRKPRAARGPIPEKERVWNRYRQLREGVAVPPHALRYVDVLVRWLSGELKNLKFPAP